VKGVDRSDVAHLDGVVPVIESRADESVQMGSRSSMEVAGIQDGSFTSLTRRHLDLGDSACRWALLVPDLLSLFGFSLLRREDGSAGSGHFFVGIIGGCID